MMPPEHDVPDCACPWCRGVGANVTADEGAGVLSDAEREAIEVAAGSSLPDGHELFAAAAAIKVAARAAADEEVRLWEFKYEHAHKGAVIYAERYEEARGRLAAVEALRDEARARMAAHPTHPHYAAWDLYAQDLTDILLAAPVAAQPEGDECGCEEPSGDGDGWYTCPPHRSLTAAQPEGSVEDRIAEKAGREFMAAQADPQPDAGVRERVLALADEWADEGSSLIRHAYSGGDVHEGQALERCARNLRAAVSPDHHDTGEGQP